MKHFFHRRLGVITTFLMISGQLLAQQREFNFEQIFEGQMLSQSTIYSICQDSRGFMWFATNDGLVRYDGYETKVYKYNDERKGSISGNKIWSINEDRSGALWVGTYADGLCRYDRETDTFTVFKHDPDDSNSISSNSILSIYEDQRGELWFGTYGGGLNQFDRESESFTCYLQGAAEFANKLNNINVIYEDQSGTLWIGTGSGLFVFDRETGIFIPLHFSELKNKFISAITQPPNGMLWIATNGLFQYDKENNILTGYDYFFVQSRVFSRAVNTLLPGNQHTLWLGTYEGLFWIDYNARTFEYFENEVNDQNSISGDHIISLYKDKSGVIWIGTSKCGINKIVPRQNHFQYVLEDPVARPTSPANIVNCLYADSESGLWIGTDFGLQNFSDGIFKQLYSREVIHPHVISSNAVWFIYKDKKNIFWIGTPQGLNKFVPREEKFFHYQHNPQDPTSISHNWVRPILEDRFGNLWIGTLGGGLNLLDRETETFTNFKHNPADSLSLGHNHVDTIFEDSFGELWIGTKGGGLSNMDRKTNKFINYKHDANDPHSLSNNIVFSIYEQNDKDKTLWIGTAAGLNRFDRSQLQFTRFKTENGLPADFITGINSDDHGNLWLTTKTEIVRFNPSLDDFKKHKVFNYSDGIGVKLINPGSFVKNNRGELIAGGRFGFVRFHPDSIRENEHIPAIVVTSFKVANEPVAFDTTISEKRTLRLSHQQNFFSCEFAALDFTDPARNQYAYKLEGFHGDWKQPGS